MLSNARTNLFKYAQAFGYLEFLWENYVYLLNNAGILFPIALCSPSTVGCHEIVTYDWRSEQNKHQIQETHSV